MVMLVSGFDVSGIVLVPLSGRKIANKLTTFGYHSRTLTLPISCCSWQ